MRTFSKILMALIMAGSVSAAAGIYVNTLADFRQINEYHILRVPILAANAYLKFRDELNPGLSLDLVVREAQTHDYIKIHGPGILEKLFNYYGIHFQTLSKEELLEALAFRNEVNRKDAEHQKLFFIRNGLWDERNDRPNPLGVELKRLENIADLVDRGEFPGAGEEFGVAQMKKASALLGRSPADQRIAIYLEENYARLVGDLVPTGDKAQSCIEELQAIQKK